MKFHAGTVNAIIGENGAGKSTLVNILSGVYPEYEGNIVFDSEPTRFNSPKDAIDHGIAMIHQELNLIAGLSIAENVFIGREFTGHMGLVDFKSLNEQTNVLLKKLKMDVHPSKLISELKVGQQQVVEIAKALSLNARVIIMDEPTSAISDHEISVLFDIIRSLKNDGVAIIYITHKMDELFSIGDNVNVLRDGTLVGTNSISDVNHDDLVHMMVGRDIDDFFVKSTPELGNEILRVENMELPAQYRSDDFILQNINFSVKKGEVLGIYGLMGAGRSELFETIFGLHPEIASGKIFIGNNEIKINSPKDAINAGIAFVPEDRKESGLILDMQLASNISLASIEKTEKFAFLNASKEKDLAEKYINRLRIKTPSLWEVVRNLSGGNQQKVVIAKWLATNPKIILMDEPTRGIDVNAKNEIYHLISELAKSGLGIVIVSSELPEIMAISDRIIVLSEGEQIAELKGKEINEETIIHAALPKSV